MKLETRNWKLVRIALRRFSIFQFQVSLEPSFPSSRGNPHYKGNLLDTVTVASDHLEKHE